MRTAALHDNAMHSLAVMLGLILTCAACASTGAATPAAEANRVTLYVVSHGWHTGVVVPTRAVAPGAWPEAAALAHAHHLEIGWGDRDYYPARDPGVGDALHAAFVPGPGVLHIVAVHGRLAEAFPASDIVALAVTPQGLAGLIAYVRASYERDATGAPIALGPSLYGEGRFYASVERFHLFNTCNVWTARALRAAGLPVASSLTAEGLMQEVRRIAAEQAAAAP